MKTSNEMYTDINYMILLHITTIILFMDYILHISTIRTSNDMIHGEALCLCGAS